MKTAIMLLVVWISTALTLCGCDASNNEISSPQPTDNVPKVMIARYTAEPVVVDGKLDEPIWKEAEVYKMCLPDDRAEDNQLEETGEVRLAWDNEYFYLGVKFNDTDIVAEGKVDQLQHVGLGDTCELFLKPADRPWYWELYVTPRGKKTTYFFPSQGRFGLPSCFEDYSSGLRVAAQCAGTLNDWQDRDDCWTAEMAMPIKDLTARGDKFGPDQDWQILVGRYNYSYYLRRHGPELSAAPRLPVTSFHLLKNYAVLKLVQ